jgi:putative ABC transport system permease protein
VFGHLARMNTYLHDVRQAVRRLVHDWRFSFAAVVLLGVGIGANTTVYSLVNAALLPTRAAVEPHRLVNLYQRGVNPAGIDANTFPAFLDMAAETSVFESAATVLVPFSLSFLDRGVVRPAIVEYASASYLSVLGLHPARGRWFTESEDRPGAAVVGVVGHAAWLRKFDGDPSIVGRTLLVQGVTVTVIGVGPVGLGTNLDPGVTADLWLPIASLRAFGMPTDTFDRRPGEAAFFVTARLRDDISVAQAQAAMDVLGSRLQALHPTEDPGRGIAVYASSAVRIHPQLDGFLSIVAAVLLVVMGLVLAIACSNLATLLLLRGTARRKELSVRLALGATRGQLIRHLLIESLLLSAAGGVAGCLLAWWTIQWTATLDLPVIVDLTLDVRALAFAAAVSIVTGLAFGLAPAIRSTRMDLVPALRGTPETPGRGRRGLTLRNALIVFQVAGSAVFLGATTLVLQMVDVAQAHPVGFAVDDVAIVETDPRYAGESAGELESVFRAVQERAGRIPGIHSVTLGRGLPMQPNGVGLLIDGELSATGDPDGGSRPALSIWAGPGYFDVLRLRIIAGRAIDARDRAGMPRVAVVSETLARRHFGVVEPAQALGRRFTVDQDDDADAWMEVVGIARDSGTADRQADLLGTTQPVFYRSFEQWGLPPTTVIAGTSLPPEAVLVPLQQALREVHPDLPVVIATSMARYLDESLKLPRLVATFLSVLGVLGVCLAGLGLYAVVAFDVARRSREIGIRTALGARAWHVIWTVAKEVAMLLGTGTAVGIGLTLVVVGVMASVEISTPGLSIYRPSVDVMAMLAIAVFMATVGVVAAFVPARRAARMDPLKALRAGD